MDQRLWNKRVAVSGKIVKCKSTHQSLILRKLAGLVYFESMLESGGNFETFRRDNQRTIRTS